MTRSSFLLATTLGVLLPYVAGAQAPAELEARLPQLTGVERVRVLAKLADARKMDQPDVARKYADEGLQLLRTYPDPPSQIFILNELLWPHMTAGRYDSATFYADSARRMARRVPPPCGRAGGRGLAAIGSVRRGR